MSANGRGICTFDAERHLYRIDGVDALSVTQALELGGLEDADYSRVPPERRAHAADKGTKAHLACDLIDLGVLDWDHLRVEAPVLVPYAEAWQRCRERERFQPDGPRVIDGETTYEERVWWKPLCVAGQLDRRGTWDGRTAIVDVKTGKKLKWQYGAQLAGYTALWLLGEGVELGAPMRKAFDDVLRRVVQLKDDGSYHVETYKDPDDLDTFLGALVVAQAKRKRARGPLLAAVED